jgi:hypothetical protein
MHSGRVTEGTLRQPEARGADASISGFAPPCVIARTATQHAPDAALGYRDCRPFVRGAPAVNRAFFVGRCAAALLSAFALAGCTVELAKDPCVPADLSGCIIERVDLEGTRGVDADDVLEKIATAESAHPLGGILEGVPVLGVFDTLGVQYERLDRFILERDLQRIQRFMQARGYYEARVTAGRVRRIEGTEDEEGGPRVQVEIHIVEGRPVVLLQRAKVVVQDALEPVDLQLLLARGNSPDDVQTAAERSAHGILILGQPFDEAKFDEAKAAIARRLGDMGFAYVTVEGAADVRVPEHVATVDLRVTTGPVCVFGPISIDGAGEVPEWIVRSVLGFSPGRKFSVAALKEAESALADLGVFGAISVSPVLPEPGKPRPRAVPIQVSVTPSALRSVRTGIGVEAGDRVAARGFAGWENRNTFGTYEGIRPHHGLDRFNVDGKPRLVFYPLKLSTLFEQPPLQVVPEMAFRTRYAFPLRFEPRTTLFAQAEVNFGMPTNVDPPDNPKATDNILGYREIIGRFGFERRFYPWRLLVVPSHNMLREDPFSYNLPELPGGLEPLTIQYLGLFLELDQRKNRKNKFDPVETAKGWYASVDLQYAGLGADAEDVRVRPEVRAFFPLSKRLVFAGRLTTGLLFTQNYAQEFDQPISVAPLRPAEGEADEALRRPIARQLQILQLRGLFSGGPNSNRGYGYNEIGPQRVLDDEGKYLGEATATGGRTLIEASFELRWRISGPFGTVFFLDSSDVTIGEVDYRVGRPHLSLGSGFRYMTPVGPLRFDLGVRVPGLQTAGQLETSECVTNRACAALLIEDSDPGTIFGIPMAVHLAIGDAF